MTKKVYYYTDEINEDFAKIGLKRPTIDENYKFIRKNKWNNFWSGVLYYCIAMPVLHLIALLKGVRIKNKRNLKVFKNKGIFIYANHTSYLDAFLIQVLACGIKRTNIVGYSDATTIPFVKHLCRALGYLPIPTTIKGTQKFLEAIEYYIKKRQNILIYPEAHIWPYYTGIRNFKSDSFKFPVIYDKKTFAFTVTYQQRKNSEKANITVYVDGPFVAPKDLSKKERELYLRNVVYDTMVERSKESTYSVHEYVKIETDN